MAENKVGTRAANLGGFDVTARVITSRDFFPSYLGPPEIGKDSPYRGGRDSDLWRAKA